MILLIKDSYNISGGAYHELAAICKSLPRHYKIKQRIRKLNKLWNIRPIPHGIGIQQSLEQRLPGLRRPAFRGGLPTPV